MKRFAIIFLCIVAGAAVALSLMASRYEPKVRSKTTLGPIDVSGLTKIEAANRLRTWWEGEKQESVSFHIPNSDADPLSIKLSETGLRLDDAACVAQLPVDDFWDSAREVVSKRDKPTHFSLKFKSGELEVGRLARYVRRNNQKPEPARVTFEGSQIVRQPEKVGFELDSSKLGTALVSALQGDKAVEVPMKEASKKVADSELGKITDVVSQFTTHFPAYKVSRNTNIRLAASKINGTVIPPGGTFSFNTVVGRRTIEDGFKEAPVFANGKHDMGVGGGICQVSSTLYNAALFADLKIKQRHNHSLPVAYLPPGRDATVDYGSLDLVLENNTAAPIALSSVLTSDTITFRVLGEKDPSLDVKIESDGFQTWSNGTKTVDDPTLPAGKKKVLDKGASGRSINTYRLVYHDGKLDKREPLGKSYYKGGPKVVAVGTKPAPAAAAPSTSAPKPGTPSSSSGPSSTVAPPPVSAAGGSTAGG